MPSCGLAPGCPAATDWLALVMTPWLKRASEIPDQVWTRAYDDDLTPWSKDPVDCVDHVTELVALTEKIADDTGPKANVLKSSRFGTNPDIR
eukprot:9310013-Heterocapsa_arctica.AAC.1